MDAPVSITVLFVNVNTCISVIWLQCFILISLLQTDAPVTPGSKGLLYFRERISDDMKQKLRERIFECKKEDIISVCTM